MCGKRQDMLEDEMVRSNKVATISTLRLQAVQSVAVWPRGRLSLSVMIKSDWYSCCLLLPQEMNAVRLRQMYMLFWPRCGWATKYKADVENSI